MRRLISYFLAGCLFSLVFSCKDDEDGSVPVISFMNPAENYIVYMPDTLEVVASITDDRKITTVTLAIVNEDKTPVIAQEYFYPDSNQFTLHAFLEITDKNLAGGDYQIQVIASDGTNSKNGFRSIRIVEIPVTHEGFIAVTSQTGIKSDIHKLSADHEPDTLFSLNQAQLLSAVKSSWEKFFFISDEPSVLTAYDAVMFEPEWEVNATPPRPEITDIISDEEVIFSTANGDVTILDKNGNIRIRTAAYESKKITKISSDNNYVYAAHISLSGDIRELTVYYRETGEIRDQKLLSGEIRALVAFGGFVFIFMPSGNDILILEYDPEDMILNQVNIIQNQNLGMAVNIAGQEIFLLLDDGVMSYVPYNNNLFSFTTQPYQLCRYDYLNDDVFLVKGKDVFRFDRNSGDLLSQINFQDEVLDFQILYNK
jgi:hypothetical protein